jgi:hypothetical protein
MAYAKIAFSRYAAYCIAIKSLYLWSDGRRTDRRNNMVPKLCDALTTAVHPQLRAFGVKGEMASLTICTLATDDEMDGAYYAVCMDTGELLAISGRLADSIERLPLTECSSDVGDATLWRLGMTAQAVNAPNWLLAGKFN